jgi:hypothetical protein
MVFSFTTSTSETKGAPPTASPVMETTSPLVGDVQKTPETPEHLTVRAYWPGGMWGRRKGGRCRCVNDREDSAGVVEVVEGAFFEEEGGEKTAEAMFEGWTETGSTNDNAFAPVALFGSSTSVSVLSRSAAITACAEDGESSEAPGGSSMRTVTLPASSPPPVPPRRVGYAMKRMGVVDDDTQASPRLDTYITSLSGKFRIDL